jgi:hypothetical protein
MGTGNIYSNNKKLIWISVSGLVVIGIIIGIIINHSINPTGPKFIYSIYNPYRIYNDTNYSIMGSQVFFADGQLHCHSTRGEEDKVGILDASDIMNDYKLLGYEFISITDHANHDWRFDVHWSQTNTNPSPNCGVVYIPGQERNIIGPKHILLIGMKDEVVPNDNDVQPTINWITKQGGLAIAAHPEDTQGHEWETNRLLQLYGINVEINDTATGRNTWDSLLSSRNLCWGVCSDDMHYMPDMAWGSVCVPCDIRYPASTEPLLLNLRSGDFYSVRSPGNSPRAYPSEGSNITSISVGDSNKITIRCREAISCKVIGNNHQVFASCELDNFHNTFTYKVTFNEGDYIRFEVKGRRGFLTYSQPILLFGQSYYTLVRFDYNSLSLRRVHTSPNEIAWGIVANGSRTIATFKIESNAKRAISIMRSYKIDRQLLTQSDSNMDKSIFLSGEKLPIGVYPDEIETSIAPQKLYTIYQGDKWIVDDGSGIYNQIFSAPYSFNACQFISHLIKYRAKKMIVIEQESNNTSGLIYYKR